MAIEVNYFSVEVLDQNAAGTLDHRQKFAWSYYGLNCLIVGTFDDGNNGTADAQSYVARYTYDMRSDRTQVTKDVRNDDNSTFTAM